jgi:Ni,Fe-hydrogenase III small subunit
MNKKQRTLLLKQLIAQRKQSLKSLQPKPTSLFIRHLDCGSCNACELELNALANPIFDSAQWGIHFEASPRHADILVLTGPYVRSLDKAARLTLEAMPVARIITVGDCAKEAGDFKNSYSVKPYPDETRQAVIAHVPGCPPTPEKILGMILQVVSLKKQQDDSSGVTLNSTQF